MEGNQPIVIDNGTGVMKAGFAGGEKPRVIFRSCVGRTKHHRVIPGGTLDGSNTFIGSKAEEHRGALILSYPIEHGIVHNWDDMERIWTHVYSKENLNAETQDHAVLLTEPPLNPYSSRERSSEIFFESLNAPALFFSIQAILSLYASGRTTGVVLDIGDGVTHSVPVYEGFALPHAVTRLDLAGRDVTNYLQLQLRRAGHIFTTSSEFETIRTLKETCCNVSQNAMALDNEIEYKEHPFQLPDGSVINVGREAYRSPEILFQPDLIGHEGRGVHDTLVRAIAKTDLDLRRAMYSQIVLAGGCTLFPGFGERLVSELRRHPLSPRDTRIRIAAPPERMYSTWIGGSILASLSAFKGLWVTRAQFQEDGVRAFSKSL